MVEHESRGQTPPFAALSARWRRRSRRGTGCDSYRSASGRRPTISSPTRQRLLLLKFPIVAICRLGLGLERIGFVTRVENEYDVIISATIKPDVVRVDRHIALAT